MTAQVTSEQLILTLQSARQRTLELLEGLTAEQLVGPKLPILNPTIWEIGHVAWFYEFFILRQEYGHQPLLDRGDALYDSIAVAHNTRWDLPVYPLGEMKDYMAAVQETLISRLEDGLASERDSYLYQFTAFHEDMHDEAFTWARQTLAYPTPCVPARWCRNCTAACRDGGAGRRCAYPRRDFPARIPARRCIRFR